MVAVVRLMLPPPISVPLLLKVSVVARERPCCLPRRPRAYTFRELAGVASFDVKQVHVVRITLTVKDGDRTFLL